METRWVNAAAPSMPIALSQARGMAAAHARQAAFTIIEMLAVIAVVLTLGALLVPVSQKGLAVAQEKRCAANLRQWGVAFLLYAADHEGYLPHPDGRERNPAPGAPDAAHPEHEMGYMDVLPPYLGEIPWRDYPPGKKPTRGIWQCPSARPLPDEAYDYKPSVDGYFSYAMNSYLAHDFLFGLPWNVEPQPSFLALSKCVAPAKTILMFEQTLDPNQTYGQSGGNKKAGFYGAEDARALAERHSHMDGGLGCNVLYLDGHVDWRNDLWDKTLKNPRIPKRGDLTWFPYPY
jgi:prepilin-type processing-associated H-X9-DG protein